VRCPTHALNEADDRDQVVTWLEPVTDKEYNA
jgi:hypothetical protein